MPASFDPAAILEALNRHQVSYVVIGGYAAELHQARVPATRDIDITPSTEAENLDRLSDALRELGALIRTAGVPEGLAFDHDGASLGRVRVWNLQCEAGDLDISFRPDGTEGYAELAPRAIVVNLRGAETAVADLADISRSKAAAGRAKDLMALPALRARLDEQARMTEAEVQSAIQGQVSERLEALRGHRGDDPSPPESR